MLKTFIPTWETKSIYDISPITLKKRGIKVVLADLDNTLIKWNNATYTPELEQWVTKLNKYNIKLVVISNNRYHRVERVLTLLKVPFVANAFKPLPRGINKVVKDMKLDKRDVVMIGDQVLTDIWVAHNSHIKSILVQPLVKTDKWMTRINRYLEFILIKYINKHYSIDKW